MEVVEEKATKHKIEDDNFDDVDDYSNCCSVKMKLNSLETSHHMTELINELVQRSTMVMRYGSLLFNLYVRQNDYILGSSLQMIYYHCLRCFAYLNPQQCPDWDNQRLREELETMKGTYFAEVTVYDFRHFSDFLHSMAKEMKTNTENHLDLQWWPLLFKWSRRKIWILKSLTGVKLPKTAGYDLTNHMINGTPFDTTIFSKAIQQKINKYSKLTKFSNEDNWKRHLCLIKDLLRDLEKDRKTKLIDRPKSLFSGISIAPECSVHAKHLGITNTNLKAMLKYLYDINCDKIDKDLLWSMHFPGIRKSLRKRLKFKYFLRTDGVSATIFVENTKKPKKPRSRKKVRKKRRVTTTTDVPAAIDVPAANDIASATENVKEVFIDPGFSSIVTLIVGMDDRVSKEDILRMTSKEYYHLMGSFKSKQWMDSKLKELLGATAIKDDSTPTCSSAQSYLEHIKVQMKIDSLTVDFYCSKLFKNKSFTKYRNKQRAMNALISRIVGNDRNQKVICAVGDFSKSTFRGCRSVPNIAWRRMLEATPNVTVIDIDEYHTSKTCHVCGEVFAGEADMRKHITASNYYKLRLCQQYASHNLASQEVVASDGTVIDRDLNACYNMRKCYIALKEGSPRPGHLSRE